MRLRRNTVVDMSRVRDDEKRGLLRGRMRVYRAMPVAIVGRDQPAFADPRTRVSFTDPSDAKRMMHELDRDYPEERWYLSDAQVSRGKMRTKQPRIGYYWHRTPDGASSWQEQFDPMTAWLDPGERFLSYDVDTSELTPTQRSKRKPRRNPIPPPPPDIYSRHFRTWVERTFPIGSTFRWETLLCRVTGVRGMNLLYKIVPGLRDPHGGFAVPFDEQVDLFERSETPLLFDKLRELYLKGEVRPTDDHWAPFQGTAVSMKHRRLAPNVIPPAPGLAPGYKTLASASYGAWVERTYQPGTRVAFPKGIATLVGWLPSGARGIVDHVHTTFDPRHRLTDDQRVFVRVTDARDATGYPLPQFAGHVMQIDSLYYPAAGLDMSLHVVPLDDNWDPAAPMKRTSLPAAQRGRSMKHRRLAPNVIPPPPTNPSDLKHWAVTTYDLGTRVRLLKPAWGSDYDGDSVKLPVGSVGYVRAWSANERHVEVTFRQQVPLFSSMSYQEIVAGFDVDETFGWLEPLDDNWGPQTVPMKRPYKGKHTAPNKRTSRRVSPNASPDCDDRDRLRDEYRNLMYEDPDDPRAATHPQRLAAARDLYEAANDDCWRRVDREVRGSKKRTSKKRTSRKKGKMQR